MLELLYKIRTYAAPWYHFVRRIHLILQYNIRVYLNQSLELQIAALSIPAFPEIYWVDIADIKFNGLIEQSHQSGRYCSGATWQFPEMHERISVFDEMESGAYRFSVHETIKLLCIVGVPYTDLHMYKDIVNRLNEGSKKVWGCKNENDVKSLFEGRLKAFASMKQHGYMTQRELGRYNFDEISIYFNKDGEIVKGIGGNHRILMAEAAGIKSIAVVVRGADREFVKNVTLKYKKHPALALKNAIRDDMRLKKTKL